MSFSEQTTVFPTTLSTFSLSLAEEPVLIDGMKVLFDEKVALYPITLKEPAAEPSRSRS